MSGCESEGGSVIPARMEAKWRPNEGRVKVELGLAHPTRSPQQQAHVPAVALTGVHQIYLSLHCAKSFAPLYSSHICHAKPAQPCPPIVSIHPCMHRVFVIVIPRRALCPLTVSSCPESGLTPSRPSEALGKNR